MWPVEAITPLLPAHLLPFEDTDFVQLRCSRCDWIATYSAAGVRIDTLIIDARTHARTHEEVK